MLEVVAVEVQKGKECNFLQQMFLALYMGETYVKGLTRCGM